MLLMLAGFGWLYFRISELERRLEKAEHRGAALDAASSALPASTPVSAASRTAGEAAGPGPTIGVEPEPALTRSEPEPPRAPQRPPGPPVGQRVRSWLEENGLAWAGGAVLALGGLFLATYAAQRGLLAPPFRIAAAMAVGLALVAASEWLRRRAETDVRGHRLAAALAAGAGAATLYGAAWAAHALYGLVGVAAAASILGLTCVGLLTLALRHGQPLALLALVGGFLAPALTDATEWSAAGLTFYLGLLIVTGFAVAGLRRWGQAGLATVAGAMLWAAAALIDASPLRAAALALAPAVIAFLAVEWSRRAAPAGDEPRGSFALMAPLAFGSAALVLALLWLVADAAPYAATAAAALAGLSVAGVQRRLIPAPLQLAAYAACLAPVFWRELDAAETGAGFLAAMAVATAGAGLANALASKGAGQNWAGAGASASLALAIAIGAGPWPAWVPEVLACAVLLAAGARLVKAGEGEARALGPAIWLWTSGAAAIAALNEGIDARALPAALAVLSAGVAAMHARLRWWGLSAVTLAASLAALAALVSPAMFSALAGGDLAWPVLAAEAALSTGLIFLAARLTARVEGARASAEALSTGALVLLLSGAFLLLRPWGPGGALDPFLEAGLRTLLLVVAGLSAAIAAAAPEPDEDGAAKLLPAVVEEAHAALVSGEPAGVIGRWRGQALLLLGLAHAVVFQLLLFNPLWASWTPAIAGPPVFDSLAAGLVGPAILLVLATDPRVSIRRWLLGAFLAGAATLSFAGGLLEVRRLFQGATLEAARDVIGRSEAAAYGLACLGAAAATLWLGDLATRRRLTVSSLAAEIVAVGRAGAWGALLLAIVIFGYGASPWWGPVQRPLDSALDAGLLLGLYAAAAACLVMVGLGLAGATRSLLQRALRLGGIALAFALVTLAVRAGFRGLDMAPDAREAGLETWAFSAVWGLFGFGLLLTGVARRVTDLRLAGLAVLFVTLGKIFVFDLARLEGLVRAASFLAVGALLLAAAVLARRLAGEGWRAGGPRPAAEEGQGP